ncbi:hypothetical protein ACJX0J_031376, partial [Zea mays]
MEAQVRESIIYPALDVFLNCSVLCAQIVQEKIEKRRQMKTLGFKNFVWLDCGTRNRIKNYTDLCFLFDLDKNCRTPNDLRTGDVHTKYIIKLMLKIEDTFQYERFMYGEGG